MNEKLRKRKTTFHCIVSAEIAVSLLFQGLFSWSPVSVGTQKMQPTFKWHLQQMSYWELSSSGGDGSDSTAALNSPLVEVRLNRVFLFPSRFKWKPNFYPFRIPFRDEAQKGVHKQKLKKNFFFRTSLFRLFDPKNLWSTLLQVSKDNFKVLFLCCLLCLSFP